MFAFKDTLTKPISSLDGADCVCPTGLGTCSVSSFFFSKADMVIFIMEKAQVNTGAF